MLKQAHFIPLVCLALVCSNGRAQCIATGSTSPSNSSNNTSIGTVGWVSLSNLFSSDNARATAAALGFGDNTNYIVITGFTFSIPSTASICGISAQVEKSATGILPVVADNSVKIVKAGTILGTDHALSGNWSTSDATTTYGSSSDAWGTTWTPSDINDSGFGIAISAQLVGGSIVPVARIDYATINVYYDIPLPIKLINFDALRADHYVSLYWSTSFESDNAFFTIERSHDNKNWSERGTITAAGNSNSVQQYSFQDSNAENTLTYYRLKQTDFNGNTEYSKIITANPFADDSEDIRIYPNPNPGYFMVRSSQTIHEVRVINAVGEIAYHILPEDESTETDVRGIAKGNYLLQVFLKGKVINRKVVVR